MQAVERVGSRGIFRPVLRGFAALMLACPLLACVTSSEQSAGLPSRDGAIDPIRDADLRARAPAATGGQSAASTPFLQPVVFPGADEEPAPARDSGSSVGVQTAANGAIVRGDGVEINFEGADVQTVAKSLLGDILGFNCAVDPRVQGTVTLASAGPIPRNDVLPMFESVLRMSNAAIVHDGSLMRIVPIPEAAGSAPVSPGVGQPGFGVSVVTLRYTSAATIAHAAENFLTRPGAIRVDVARNLLLIQGTTAERQAALDMVATFDVEWLRDQSVGVYPLRATSPETIIHELERLFEIGEGGRGQDVIHFQPISRMNAVMVVAKSAKLLAQASQWVQRLDRSDSTGTTVRVYRLQYGSASKVAKILNDIFVGRSSPAADMPAGQTAPGSTTTASKLDALGGSGATTTQIASADDQRSSSGVSSSRPTGAIAAAFDSFADHRNSDADTGASPISAMPRGVFQNVRVTANPADNSIVIYSNPEDYRVIERSLRELDRPQLQVAIDAMVAEVTLTDELQYGVQAYLTSSAVGAGSDKGSVGLFNAAQSTAQTALLSRVLPAFNLLLGSESNPKLILNALSTLTTVKVLSAPSLVVTDSQPAILEVGNEIPISTGSATVLTTSNTVVNTIEMKSTGIILKVLPHVHANGSIELEIEQEISNVVNPTAQTLTPTISQRKIHSTVRMTSGQTVLLGGLISQNDEKTDSGLPGLRQIKFLGDLLSNKTDTKNRSEIIVFVKSQLIRDGADAERVTEEFRDRLESMRRTPSVINGSDSSPRAAPAARK